MVELQVILTTECQKDPKISVRSPFQSQKEIYI